MTKDFREFPVLREVFEYWDKARGERGMPRRADLDPPRKMPRLLKHIQLMDVVNGGERFFCRVIGTAIVEALGRDGTGKHLDELFSGERLAFVEQSFREVCETRKPQFSRDVYETDRGIHLTANRLFLPLSEDGLNVDQVLGAITFEFAGGPLSGVWDGKHGGHSPDEPKTQKKPEG